MRLTPRVGEKTPLVAFLPTNTTSEPILQTQSYDSIPRKAMFFFFIGGVRPSITKVLQSSFGPCLNCSGQMDLVEMAQTLELFWLPVYTFDRKQVLHCQQCQLATGLENYETMRYRISQPVDPAHAPSSSGTTTTSSCRRCGGPIMDPSWKFCPTCGVPIDY
jgi:hypothetical protein